MGLECLGARRSYGRNDLGRLVPTVGMTWGTPRSYGRNIEVGLECFGARLVPTVGMTWGTPRSYGRNDLGQASFLR